MRLPIFPLHLVLFPNEVIRLHIFEPRYQQMLKDVTAGDRTFGVVLIRSGRDVGEAAEPYDIGTTAVVRDSESSQDGRANISVVGRRRFETTQLFTDLPYLSADCEFMEEPANQPGPDEEKLAGLRESFRIYLETIVPRTARAVNTALPEDPVELINLVCAAIQVSLVEKQKLLETPAIDRIVGLIGILAREATIAHTIGPSAAIRPWLKKQSAN